MPKHVFVTLLSCVFVGTTIIFAVQTQPPGDRWKGGFGRGSLEPPGPPAPVPPAVSNRRKCEEANRIIARLDDQKHVFFLNINSKFLDDKGGLIGFRPSDHLQPVEQGYEIWASAVAPTLKSWVK